MPRDEVIVKNLNNLSHSKELISAAFKIFSLRLLVYKNDDYFNKIQKSFFLLPSFQQINKKEKINMFENREKFKNINIIKACMEEKENYPNLVSIIEKEDISVHY